MNLAPATIAAPWLVDVQRAARATLSSSTLSVWLATLARDGSRPVDELAAADFAATCRYRFEGRSSDIAGLDACRARGWAACGDAVAVLAAVAHRLGNASRAAVLVEAPASLPSYAHVRLMVRRERGRPVVLDPYGRFAAPRRPSAEYICTVAELLSSPSPSLARLVGPTSLAAVVAA